MYELLEEFLYPQRYYDIERKNCDDCNQIFVGTSQEMSLMGEHCISAFGEVECFDTLEGTYKMIFNSNSVYENGLFTYLQIVQHNFLQLHIV